MSIGNAFYQGFKGQYPDEYFSFNDGIPNLKQGYSTSGSIGGSKKVYTIKGKKSQYTRWGGGKDSYKWTGGTPDINIYKLPTQAPATPKAKAAPAPVASYRPTSLPSTAAPAAPDYSKYQAQVASLGKALSGLQSQLKTNSAAYAKSIADQQKNFAGQFANQTASFNNLFATQQAGFNKNLADQSAAFKQEIADQTTKYDNNMSALRNSLSETMSNKAQPVMGVKSGAYGQQTAAMQRQGIKGTFGRSGLRIKGIKDNSLNI